jgi:hypothetical protein
VTETKADVPKWVAVGRTVWTGGQAWATCDMPGQAARVAEDMNRVELLEAAIRAVQSDRGAGHMSDKTIAAIDVALNGRDGAPSGG